MTIKRWKFDSSCVLRSENSRDVNPESLRFGTRIYDPALCRWSVPDPAAQFANPYLAMDNDPLVGVGPDGRYVHIIAGAIIGTFVGLAIGMASGNMDASN